MKKIIYTIFVFFLVCNLGFSQEETLVGDVTNATMENNCEDGSIDLTINGGFPPYDVIWDFQPADSELPLVNDYSTASEIMGNNDGEDIESPAEEGTYTVFVTDALCGTATASFTIECECPECELTGSVTNEKCSSENGAIAVGISCEGEEANNQYTYQWSDLDPGVSQSASRADLSEGEYCVTVTDEENCEYSNCWTVENEIIPTPRATLVSQENITFCIEGETPSCTGALSIDVPEGSEVEWLNIPNQNEVNSLSVSDLCVGVYQVEVLRDGCGFTWSFEIECCITEGQDSDEFIEPIEITADISHLANDLCNGSISLQSNYSFNDLVVEWSGPEGFYHNEPSITSLCAGTYCVNVSNGCLEPQQFCYDIIDCENLGGILEFELKNTCDEYNKGEITLLPNNLELEILWSTGANTNSINGLSVGTYSVTISSINCNEVEELVYSFEINNSLELECFKSDSGEETKCKELCYCNGELVREWIVFSEYGPIEYGTGFNGWCAQTLYCDDEHVGTGPKHAFYKRFAWEVDFAIGENHPCLIYRVCPIDGAVFQTANFTEREVRPSFINGNCCYHCRRSLFNWVLIPGEAAACAPCCVFCFSDPVPQNPTSISSCIDNDHYLILGDTDTDSSFVSLYDNDNLNEIAKAFVSDVNVLKAEYQNDCSTVLVGTFSQETILNEPLFFGSLDVKGKEDIFIIKLDQDSILSWSYSFGSTELDLVSGLTIDQDDNILITGYAGSRFDLQNNTILNDKGSFILKLDKNGLFLSKSTLESSNNNLEIFNSVISAKSSSITSGTFKNKLIINNNLEQVIHGNGFFLNKSGTNGNHTWSHIFEIGQNSIKESKLILLNDDSFLSLLSFNGRISSQELGVNESSHGVDGYLIMKFSSTGDLLWHNAEYSASGSLSIKDIEIVNEDYFVIGGDFSGELVSKNEESVIANGEKDLIFIYYNMNGEILSVENEGTSSAEYFADMIVDKDSLVIVGYFIGSETIISEDSFEGVDDYPNNYIVKKPIAINTTEERSKSLLMQNSSLNNSNIEIAPNPFLNEISVEFNSSFASNLVIIDALGHIVYKENVAGLENCIIDLNRLENGIYIVVFYDGNGAYNESRKIIKN